MVAKQYALPCVEAPAGTRVCRMCGAQRSRTAFPAGRRVCRVCLSDASRTRRASVTQARPVQRVRAWLSEAPTERLAVPVAEVMRRFGASRSTVCRARAATIPQGYQVCRVCRMVKPLADYPVTRATAFRGRRIEKRGRVCTACGGWGK